MATFLSVARGNACRCIVAVVVAYANSTTVGATFFVWGLCVRVRYYSLTSPLVSRSNITSHHILSSPALAQGRSSNTAGDFPPINPSIFRLKTQKNEKTIRYLRAYRVDCLLIIKLIDPQSRLLLTVSSGLHTYIHTYEATQRNERNARLVYDVRVHCLVLFSRLRDVRFARSTSKSETHSTHDYLTSTVRLFDAEQIEREILTVDGRTDGWTDGRTDERTDGERERETSESNQSPPPRRADRSNLRIESRNLRTNRRNLSICQILTTTDVNDCTRPTSVTLPFH
jgi:hypothetical protein